MSLQFGRWNFDGQPPTSDYVKKVGAAFALFASDNNESYSKDGLSILYRAFRTTKEADSEVQPHSCPSGAVLTWDGRLDNRAELIDELCGVCMANSTDVEIVAAAYEKWGTKCLRNLIGDWALSV